MANMAAKLIHPDPDDEGAKKYAEKILTENPDIVRLWLELTRAGQDNG